MTTMGIDKFKSTINQRDGLAKGNFFTINMPIPFSVMMAFGSDGISDINDLTILCRSTTLPGRQITTIDTQTHKQIIKIPHSFVQEDVTFSFILTQDFYVKKLFDIWLSTVFDFNRYKAIYMNTFTRDITIRPVKIDFINKLIKDQEQREKPQNVDVLTVYETTLYNAYPVSVQAVPLSTESGNSVIEVSVSFTYESFDGDNFQMTDRIFMESINNAVGAAAVVPTP